MTQAGNTTQTMKPKEVIAEVPTLPDKVWIGLKPGSTVDPKIDFDLEAGSTDVNTLSDVLADIPYVNEEASLRGRVIDLESRVSVLEDRIARHNVNSAWKIPG